VDLTPLREAFGERVAIAVWRHLDDADRPRMEAALAASAATGVPIVASARPSYHHRSRKPLADVVSCIRLGTTLERAGRLLSPNAEAELKPADRMLRLFPDHPEWIARTADVADRCRFSLAELRYHFPCEGYGEPDLTPDEILRRAV